MPDAWWTTNRKLAPSSSSVASAPGEAWACMASTAWAATPASTSAVGVLVVSHRAGLVAVEVEGAEADGAHLKREPEHGPGARRHRRRREGQPAGRVGLGQVGLEHGRFSWWASTQGPSPRVYCNSSIRSLTALLEHTEPCCTSPVMSMMPAPLMSATSAQTSHSRAGSGSAADPADSRARMRRSRSPPWVPSPVDPVRPSGALLAIRGEALNEVRIKLRTRARSRRRTKPSG